MRPGIARWPVTVVSRTLSRKPCEANNHERAPHAATRRRRGSSGGTIPTNRLPRLLPGSRAGPMRRATQRGDIPSGGRLPVRTHLVCWWCLPSSARSSAGRPPGHRERARRCSTARYRGALAEADTGSGISREKRPGIVDPGPLRFDSGSPAPYHVRRRDEQRGRAKPPPCRRPKFHGRGSEKAVMPTVARSSSLCLESTPTDRGTRVPRLAIECHHSDEAFDTSFRCVRQRKGLTLADRAVHGAMVSLHRLNRLGKVTQEEIAEWACVGLRTVVRSVQRLSAAGLVLVKRLGQGKPNKYDLIGMDADALGGRSAKDSQPAVPGTQIPTRRESRPKNTSKNRNQTGVPGTGRNYLETSSKCPGCGLGHVPWTCRR